MVRTDRGRSPDGGHGKIGDTFRLLSGVHKNEKLKEESFIDSRWLIDETFFFAVIFGKQRFLFTVLVFKDIINFVYAFLQTEKEER